MKLIIQPAKYVKGGNEGTVAYFSQHEKPFCAVTAVESRWFKTQLGAQKFMAKRGYVEVK